MSLKEKVEKLSAMLDERPGVESKGSLSSAVTKLVKAIDDFLAKAEPETYRDTREYAELWGLLMLPENKAIVTLDWLNQHAARFGGRYEKAGKKERDAFALALVGSGQANSVIKELRDSPRRMMEDALNALVGLTDTQISERLKSMKPKELEQFCRLNDILLVRTPKGSLDRKKSLPHVLEKTRNLEAYLKL